MKDTETGYLTFEIVFDEQKIKEIDARLRCLEKK
jgi:hypothetical protein